jgi:hypothetical protein
VTSVPVPMLIGFSSDQVFIRNRTASVKWSICRNSRRGWPLAPDLHRIAAIPRSGIDLREQGWQDVAGEQVEIVVGAIKIRRHHRHEIAAMLPAVGPGTV